MATDTNVKKERGEGPVIVTYGDADGKKDFKRVPAKVTSVIVTARNGGASKVYEVSKLSPETLSALAAFALASRTKTYVNNHAGDDGSDVIKLADQVYSDFMTGKLYSRVEGGSKPGKKFDATIYVDAAKAAMLFMSKKGMKNKAGKPVQAMTEAQASNLLTKLTSLTPKERTEQIKSMKANKFFTKALMELQAKKIDTSKEDAEDLF